jgi:hypothetical protein
VLKRLLPVSLLLALALPVAAGASPKATTSIVGGQNATIAEWPSIAFLLSAWDEDGDGEMDGSAGCTGTVIAPQWILTAAHCAFRPDGQGVDAMLSVTGAADYENEVGEVLPADRVVVHPNWDEQQLIGDMLLLHLPEASSRPAMPLALGGVTYGLDPTVPNAAGWGLTDEAATQSTTLLQDAFVAVQDDAVCADFDPTYDPNTQTCAGTPNVAGVCRGDSGGPLTVLDQAGVPHLWGVTSYGTQLMHGLPPCSRQAPAVFSWVPAFSTWIEQTMSPAPPPPPPRPGGGNPPPPVQNPPRDTTVPVLSRAKLSAKKLRAAGKGATIARRTGAKLSFTLSEAAAVRIAVLKGSKALSPTATLAGQAGKTTKKFTGRVGGKRLKPGRYRLQLGAVDAAGNAAKAVRIPFRIVK